MPRKKKLIILTNFYIDLCVTTAVFKIATMCRRGSLFRTTSIGLARSPGRQRPLQGIFSVTKELTVLIAIINHSSNNNIPNSFSSERGGKKNPS